MSASHEWTEWCLTPRGWERGCEKEDVRGLFGERPKDTVLVMIYDDYRGNWRDVNPTMMEKERVGTDKEITTLLTTYGPPPEQL